MDLNNGMPVFVIKAKDALAVQIIQMYGELCLENNLINQAHEVNKALTEFKDWQLKNTNQVKFPDHKHMSINPHSDHLHMDFKTNPDNAHVTEYSYEDEE